MPYLFVVLTLVSAQVIQLVRYLFDDMRGYLGNVSVRLEIASRNVKRKLGTVKHTLEDEQIVGYDLLDVVRNEDLIVIELYLTLDGFIFVSKLGEVEDTLEVKGIVGIYMNMEKGLAIVGKDLSVELAVFLV